MDSKNSKFVEHIMEKHCKKTDVCHQRGKSKQSPSFRTYLGKDDDIYLFDPLPHVWFI